MVYFFYVIYGQYITNAKTIPKAPPQVKKWCLHTNWVRKAGKDTNIYFHQIPGIKRVIVVPIVNYCKIVV